MGKKVESLKKDRQFKIVYKHGRNYWNKSLTLYMKKNGLNYNRVGYSITKKIGNSVVRNKLRRRMKEIMRLNFDDIKDGYDLILIPKKSTVNMDYYDLEKEIIHLLKRSGLLKK